LSKGKEVCALCHRDLVQGAFSVVDVGPLKGKNVCNDCRPKSEHIALQARLARQERARGPIIDDDAKLKEIIGQLLNETEITLKNTGGGLQLGFALTDDRTMWNIILLRTVISMLKVSAYYDELLLRKLDTIQEALKH